jgi:hypothetical protein
VTSGRARVAALLLLVVGAAIGALAPSAPVAADPPQPTNYRSEVLEVSPPLPEGASVRILGGDSFFELSVAPGQRATIVDYGEDPADPAAVPYLRFGDDGVVERNRNADATAVNDDRYGRAAPGGDRSTDWEVVATDGTYAWHDHRIHWMSTRAPIVDQSGTVDLGGPSGRWEVPLVIDDEVIVVQGRLVLLDGPSPLPWALIGVVVGSGALVAARRRGRGAQGVLVGAALVGVAATVASVVQWQQAPPDSGATPVAAAIAAVATVAAVVALLGPATVRLGASAASAAALLGWGATRWTVLTRAVLPTSLPALERAATALALGLGIALAITLVAWPPVRASQRA